MPKDAPPRLGDAMNNWLEENFGGEGGTGRTEEEERIEEKRRKEEKYEKRSKKGSRGSIGVAYCNVNKSDIYTHALLETLKDLDTVFVGEPHIFRTTQRTHYSYAQP